MLKLPLFGTPVVATLNHLLSRQPALAVKLAAHAGKVAAIDAGLLQLALRVGADGLLQAAAIADGETAVAASANVANAAKAANVANVTIRINPADLPQILADLSRAFAYVNISGDAEFAKTISDVANGLHWEAEENLAPLVGDIAAVRIAQAGREAVEAMKTGGRKLAENVAEYLLEENPTLLYRSAGEAFAADVIVLRDDVERLAKRIALLDKHMPSTTGGQP
ncbi:MAG: hypothetical protein RL404_310 [Pseudomonadota bacterium]